MSNLTYLESLQQLKSNCSIYIYGSGSMGKSFLESIKTFRDDINILGFIDSFQSGENLGYSVIKIDEFNNNKQVYDHVIICSSFTFWNEMVNKLDENGINCYFVNIFWDFDIYGEKRIDKFEDYKHLIPEIKNILFDEKGKLVFDTITSSIKDQNIKKSLEYFRKHTDKVHYDKYIKLKQGDIIINGGSSFGRESDYFSKMVGDHGMVFDFDPNIDISNNLENQPITKIPKVLWDKTTEISFRMDGSRSRVVDNNEKDSTTFPSTTIDDFIITNSLNRLDFIKLDVEGGEQNVLRGGIKSIKKFRPGLAISIYHKLEDFFQIPLLINDLVTDYIFHIELYDPYCIDTILFGIPLERR